MTGGEADPVLRLSRAAADMQQGPVFPRELIKARVGGHDEFSRKVLRGEITRDRLRHRRAPDWLSRQARDKAPGAAPPMPTPQGRCGRLLGSAFWHIRARASGASSWATGS